MKYSLTLRHCEMTPRAEKIIDRYLKILHRKLNNFVDDTPDLSLFIKHHEKNHFFSGQIILNLPKKKLVAKLSGYTLNDVIHQGFERINKEYQKYKGIQFKGGE